MAITPDQISETRTVSRIAQLLSCHNDPSCSDPAMVHGGEWMEALFEAIEAGELQPVGGVGKREKVKGLWADSRLLHRHDVYRWLIKIGVGDVDIPPGLRPVGSVPERLSEERRDQQEKPTRLLAIAVLIELLIKNGRKNYNQNAILEEIAELGLPGLSKSNLEKLVADANKALKEARKGS